MYEWGYSTIFLHLKYGSLSGFELTCCVCGLIQFRSKEFQTTKGSLRISCNLGYWRIIRLKMVQILLQALKKFDLGSGQCTEVLFASFSFRWIYNCHISKSTRKETGKTHICALYYSFNRTVCQNHIHTYKVWELEKYTKFNTIFCLIKSSEIVFIFLLTFDLI